MATPQDIQLQQTLNDELQETNKLANELINSYRTLTGEADDLFKSEAERLKLKRKEKELSKDIGKDILKSLRSQKIDSENILGLEKKRLSGTLRVKDVNTLIEKSKAKQETIVDRLNEAVLEGYIDQKKAADLQEKVTAEYVRQRLVLKRLAEEAERLEKKLGITYKIFDGISKVPILNALVNVEKVKEAMEEAADSTSSTFKVFRTGVSATFSQIGKSLKDPLILLTAQIALIKKFSDLYGGLNQRIVDQGRQLGISEKQSEAIYNRSLQYAASQRDAFVTGARITEGREKLNEALGTSIDFTDKEAITAEKLSHYYGISNEQNANIAALARQTSQTNTDILNKVLRTAVEQKKQIGGSLSYQKIVQKVSSVSGEILTKFKGNVTELTKAVQQADKLGLTLEQVDKIGESLLNFEQSIENELKAELLTGKAINLERARAAALSGNTVKLMNEIATQVGDIHKFERMNTIERQAYAEAFGMSASEMGDMLRKKDLEAKLGVDISKSASEALRLADEKGIKVEESLRKELENKSLAELQKYTFEKIKTILEKIAAGPMRTIYNLLEKGLKFAESIFGVFGKMTGGGLGSALGTVLLAAPALLLAIRGLIGFGRGLLMGPRGTDLNPMVVRLQGALGAGVGMGGGRSFVPGVGMVSGATNPALYNQFRAQGMNPAAAKQAALAQQQQMMGAASMRNMGIGLGAGVIGMGLDMVSSNMEAGGAKTAVGTLSGAAKGVAMGAVAGPYGMIIGGLLGGVYGLVTEMKATREKEAADKAAKEEREKRTQELLQQMAIRPIELNVNNETIGNWNTYSTQNGANSSFS